MERMSCGLYFLNGLEIPEGKNLHHIEEGHCCKPRSHPDGYGLCYDEGESFEREGWTNCSKLGYCITGVCRGSGDWLKISRCCQMVGGNEITSEILYDACLN